MTDALTVRLATITILLLTPPILWAQQVLLEHAGALFDNAETGLERAINITVAGDHAYVASFQEDALEIIDISDPSNPTHAAVVYDDAETALDGARFVRVVGSHAYIASRFDSGLEIIDISNPAVPVHRGAVFDSPEAALAGARCCRSGKFCLCGCV